MILENRDRGIMKNLCFRVITMAIALYFTGTMTHPSTKSSMFFSSECQWNGYLLTNCSFTGKHDIPVDISQIAATVGVSSNFFKVLLHSPPRKEEWNLKHLDLSNNLLSKIALSLLAHLPTLETLNLSNNAIHSISLDLTSSTSSWVKRHRSSLRNGLPYLKLLILRRNQLSDIPKGLWKLKSLQSLDLSFNGILQIGVSDFHNCLRLENLYLRSNKIFRIHLEAFKDLKKLQVVDLSNNALTTILPMLIIALALPHLEADLADNQWQCDTSVVVFQRLISESWRRKWDAICNKSIGNEETYWWTPRSRISKETQLPHTNLNRMKSLLRSRAGRPQEGKFWRFPTVGEKDHAGSDAPGPQRRLLRQVRSTQDRQTADQKNAPSQDLALAVCLSVFITFIVAFCLGALARPYVDRLWQQRCRKKRPSPDSAYSNEGFYDEMEAAGNIQHPQVDLHQPCHGLHLCENQDPVLGTEASPQSAVIADRTLGTSRTEPDRGQSRAQCGGDTGVGNRKACSSIRGQPNAGKSALVSAEQDHLYRNGSLGKVTNEPEAQEDPLSDDSMGAPVRAGGLQTGSGSIHEDLDELNPPLAREMAAALSNMQTYTKAQRTGETEERQATEPWEFSKEMQVTSPIILLHAQEQRVTGAHAEEEHSTYYSSATPTDLGDSVPSPLVFPPGWADNPRVTPVNEGPVQKHAPSDTQYQPDTNDDSDEGSLFTLSSESSEDAGNVTEGKADGEEGCRTSEPPEDEDSRVRKDNVSSFSCLEDNVTFQKIQGKCENQEDQFEKPLIPGSDSSLYESHQESASNTNKFENPLTLPRSLGSSPSSNETSGVPIDDFAPSPESEAAEWHCSLRDLEFFNVDILPQTLPCSAEVPSDPGRTACCESDSDIWTYEPFIQGTDTHQNSIPLWITSGENLWSSQQDSEEDNMPSNLRDTDANEEGVGPLEGRDSRRDANQTQVLQYSGGEPALRWERGGGDCFEEGSKGQVPSLQELPTNTSSLRTQEPFGDGDWGKYSEENLLQLEKDDSQFYTQMQTQSNLGGADHLGEGQLYYDKDEDVQLESQRECK